MPQYSERLLDKIAPELSRLQPFDLPQIADADFDLPRLLLQIGFWDVDNHEGAVVFAVLRQIARRASAAAQAYNVMTERLHDLFEGYQPDSPRLGSYFEALDSAETCLLALHIAMEAMNKSGFGDEPYISGSEVDACVALSNTIKHFGERRNRNRTTSVMPIWFVTGGVAGEGAQLDLVGLSDLTKGVLAEVSRLTRGRWTQIFSKV